MDCQKSDALHGRHICQACRSARVRSRKPDPLADLAIDVDEPAPAERNAARDVARVATIAILADVHGRERDEGAWAACLAWLRAHAVDEVILLGDFLELASVNEHGTNADESELLADLDTGRLLLDQLRRAVGPDSRITYLEGNHETRLPRYLAHRAAPLVGALSLPDALRLADLGIEWVPVERQPITRGAMRLLHGHGDLKFGGKFHAAKMADLWGQPGGTVVYGHVHRPQVTARICDNPPTAIGVACLRTLSPPWENRRASGWQHGFAVAYVGASGRADVYQVPIRHGVIVWDGRLYGRSAA